MSGTKKVLTPQHVVVAHSMTSSFNSAATNVQYADRASYEVSWTGTPVGTIVIQASVTGTNWANLTSSVAAGGAAGSAVFDITLTGAVQLRLSYTSSSSTGTLDAYVSYKES